MYLVNTKYSTIAVILGILNIDVPGYLHHTLQYDACLYPLSQVLTVPHEQRSMFCSHLKILSEACATKTACAAVHTPTTCTVAEAQKLQCITLTSMQAVSL